MKSLVSRWFELAVALRYLRARRKQTIISVISVIATLGVVLGVMALIIVIAVMAGFESDLRKKILGANAHVIVYRRDTRPLEQWQKTQAKVADHQEVVSVDPFVYSKLMIRTESSVDGVVLRGFDVNSSSAVQKLDEILQQGTPPDETPEPGLYLGRELGFRLGVFPGDQATLVSPFGQTTPAGVAPKTKKFPVTGLFATGMYEYDTSWIYLPLEQAQEFVGLDDRVSGLEVYVKDFTEADSIQKELQSELGPEYYVQDWMDMNQSFFNALQLEKWAMFIILTLIVVVAAFNIIGTLTMMVMEKNKDIGILKAMGASSRSILFVFMLQGGAIGTVGTAIGAALGASICWVADTYKLIQLSGSVYYIAYLPFKMYLVDVLLIICSALAISFLATIYPAWQASGLEPVEAIRYE